MQGPEVFIPLSIFVGSAVVAYKYFDGRHKERMAMIEKGVNASELKASSAPTLWKTNSFTSLKWGLMFLFVGFGIFVANLFHDKFSHYDDWVYPASMLISGGLALIVYYLVVSAKVKKEGLDS